MAKVRSLYENLWDINAFPACFELLNNYNLPHFHSALELLYVRKGSVEITVSGNKLLVPENKLIIVPNYNIHSYRTPEFAETILLIIPIHYIKKFEIMFKEKTFPEYVYEGDWLDEIRYSMERLTSSMGNPDSGKVRGYVYVILGTLTEQIQMVKAFPYDNYLEIIRILKYMEDNFRSPISIRTLSEVIGCSESHISHMFKDHVGYSFPDYLGRLRTNYAASLISDDNLSILDAAMDSGFESLCSFYRSFNRHLHMTPLQFHKLKSN